MKAWNLSESEVFQIFFREFHYRVQNNYMVTVVFRTPLDGCFSCSYSGVMPKKETTEKFEELFSKDRNSSTKVTNKFRLLKQIEAFFTWEEV